MIEEWRWIKGYDGHYEVSNLGNVRSTKIPPRPTRRPIPYTLSPNKQNNGYLTVTLSLNAKPTMKLVHRLVAEAFIENEANKLVVNHIDNNRENNCVSNLEWCTHSENNIHSAKQGRMARKLNLKQVANIRSWHNVLSNEEIGFFHAIQPFTVSQIVKRKRWAYA